MKYNLSLKTTVDLAVIVVYFHFIIYWMLVHIFDIMRVLYANFKLNKKISYQVSPLA